MTGLLALGLFLAVFLVAIVIRVPIGVAMGLGGLTALYAGGGTISQAPSAAFNSLNSFPLLAIPGFILAGVVLSAGGISQRILDLSQAVVGRFRGSLGATTVLASAAFGTVSGSSLATVAAVGGIMTPEMQKAGYGRAYPAALIGASGLLGILIPPSVPGIILAISAGLSIADVWLVTVMPALLLAVVYIAINYVVIGRKAPRDAEPLQFAPYIAQIGQKGFRASAALLMPVIIFAGIYGGVFTPTEAAFVAVAYGLVVAVVLYRTIGLRSGYGILRDAALTSASISILIAFAAIAGRMITVLGVPGQVADFVSDNVSSPIVFLLLLNVVLLILGSFMETNTSILITAPILFPAATELGIEPLHFAAVMLLNLEIGMITPPFAANLFVSCGIADITLDKIVRPLVPFFLGAVGVLLVTTLWPDFSQVLLELLKD